ncbi:MAG TPA: YegS/Rv2252/BmrU family lipid kinase, partial [Ohtaekwangia sp.]|nr:YegS/Rv2252/BmrU family lipid kinase [Ohtaekwangia sp.]
MKNEGKKVLFIVNKFAGTGYQPQIEGQITDTCGQFETECTIEFTRGPGDGVRLARAGSADGFDAVVAVGGDGTINEVARGLVHSTTPLGIIPRGSGNGLSRHLGIPLNVAAAVATALNGNVLAMDTFLVNGRLSLNVSGIGFDGHIANLFGGQLSRGLVGYAKLTMKEFLSFAEFDATLSIDTEELKATPFIIAIANSSQYGNNARVAPTASVCDDLLHINIIRKIPLYRLDFFYSVFNGDIEKSRFCTVIKGREIRIKTTQPVPYHIDGEPGGKH